MSNSEQDLSANVRAPASPHDVLRTNIIFQIQKSMAETANLFTEIRAERASNTERSEDPPTDLLY